MDNDNLCLKRAQHEIDSIIGLAITDIYNSKRKNGKIANPSDENSLTEVIKTKWIKFDELHKQLLTKKLKVLNESKTDYCKIATNRELLYYFTHYVLPYSKEVYNASENEKTNLVTACAWANDIVNRLKKINELKSAMSERKTNLQMEVFEENYTKYTNDFYLHFGNPSKRDLSILKFKLIFTKEYELFKLLLKEKENLQSIMDETYKKYECGTRA